MSGLHSYNLLDQPWIPVEWKPGSEKPNEPKVGIRTALQRAHEIKSISHTAPFIEFGLYRLLITVVLDACIVNGQRPTIGKMRAMLERKKFDMNLFEDYFEEYGERFDLWEKDNPFLQHRQAVEGARHKSTKSVVSMFPAIPSGTNVAHWHHFVEDEDDAALSEDVAALFLTTVSPFNFKVKPGEARTLAGDPPLYALVLGNNIFETIIFNIPRPSGRTTVTQERENGPAWRTRLDLDKLPKTPTMAQGFTWPVRVIELLIDGDVVTKVINKATYKKPTDKAKAKGGSIYDAKYGWRDPNAGIETTKDEIVHIKARLGVPIWRDIVPLFLIASEGEALCAERRRSRPEVISNALRIIRTPEIGIATYGMRKKVGGGDVKVEEWFRSVLSLPTEVARDSRLSARAINAFKTTQKVADTLQTALRMLRPPVKASRGNRSMTCRGDRDSLADFWHCLEPVLCRTYLDEIGSGVPEAEKTLRKSIREETLIAFAHAAGPQRRTADGLFRIANASNWLERRLAKLLPKASPQKSEDSE